MSSRPIHGSINPIELKILGLEKKELLDFSVNISPIGQPDGVWETIKTVDLSSYPDPDCLDIREAISKNISNSKLKIPIEQIFIGNGSNEIIHLISRLTLSKKSTALVMTPTYGEYEYAFRLSGAKVIKYDTNDARDFRWNFIEAVNLIKNQKPNVVIICNPNNPTGIYCNKHEIEALAKACINSGSLLVLDEAYLSFVENSWDSLSMLKNYNLILVRSMSKNYANAALRLGYAVTSVDIVSKLRALQPEWSVNSLAQKVGILALEDDKYLSNARKAVFSAKNYINKAIKELGLETVPSEVNFLLIRVENASEWRSLLLTKGIVVRDCTSLGLPNYIRVGIRVLKDCKFLVKAISEVSQHNLNGLKIEK